jgi:hypothetical protein
MCLVQQILLEGVQGGSKSLMHFSLKTTPEISVPLYSILEANMEQILGKLSLILYIYLL